MKLLKIILIVIFCFSVVSCNTNETTDKNIIRRGVISSDFDLGEKSPIKIEITEDLALKIGTAVLNSLCGEADSDLILVISEIQWKDVYVVSRMPKSLSNTGGDISVAISKIDGKILKIWGGE